jgi:hypothetical protein
MIEMKWREIRSTVLTRAGTLRQQAIKKPFPLWQRLGIHVTPNHYNEPVPDTRMLKDDIWLRDSELVGVDINEKGQLELLSLFSSRFKHEYDSFPQHRTPTAYEYYVDNGQFGSVDGEGLYCMIRHFKPRRILEIGSGNSTYLAAKAVLKNEAEADECRCELVAIDPYPNDVLRSGFPGLSALVPRRVQDIPLTEFAKLERNDILFIDSSHVLKIGSDVQYEYLEILPRLNEGVIVHVHDVFFPFEYPKEAVRQCYIFWTEQYLLQAFLAFNDTFEVMWAGNYMRSKYPDRLEAAFRSYRGQETAARSLWMRRIR